MIRNQWTALGREPTPQPCWHLRRGSTRPSRWLRDQGLPAGAAGQAPRPPAGPAASKPESADFPGQPGASPWAKPLKQAPRPIATAIVTKLNADHQFTPLCLPPRSRPGAFINSRGTRGLAMNCASGLGPIPRLGCPAWARVGASVVISPAPTSGQGRCVGHLPPPTGSSATRWRGRAVSSAAIPGCLRLNHVGDLATSRAWFRSPQSQAEAPKRFSTAERWTGFDLVLV